MIEAISAVGQSPSLDVNSAPASQTVDLGGTAFQQPTAVEVADFARAAAFRPIEEVRAAQPASADGLSSRLARQADALSAHLKTLDPTSQTSGASTASSDLAPREGGPSSADPAVKSTGSEKEKMNQAVSQMERAYMFAIETTMASRGSTEATKIFNTLLKGQ